MKVSRQNPDTLKGSRNTKMKIHLQEAYQQCNNRHYFKGMQMDNITHLAIKGIWYEADFYGLDTKKTLSLDRKKVKKEALKQIQGIIDSARNRFLSRSTGRSIVC